MSIHKLALLVLSLSTVALAAGCATETGDGDAENDDSDLSAAGKALIGSYKGTGSFHGLILTAHKAGQANEFIAEIDNGIRCFRAPCPSSEHVTGTFTAGSKTITFKSSAASPTVQALLGRYNYTVDGGTISLARKNFAESLDQVDSFCTVAADCNAQGIIHPMCVGNFTCTAQNTCGYQCGIHPVSP